LTTNIIQHYEVIVWGTLPLTFREAIHFTRRLGYQYLWIDSLCIVQDDEDEWRHESANMASIYQGADLVLSASRAADANDGLYASLPSTDFSTYIVETTNEDGGPERIAFRRGFAHLPTITNRQWKTAPEFPTLSRGWIFQERILSARVLHFGPHELAWECLCESLCQCRDFSNSSENAPGQAGAKGNSRTKALYALEQAANLEPPELTRRWHEVIQSYTALNLTFEKDIFPAISGIAKQFQIARPSSYIAGLWQASLLSDMLWTCKPPARKDDSQPLWSCRPSPWRAPTWSWASVKGHVEFINTHDGVNFYCEVAGTNVVLAGTDPTGEILEASVIVRGHMIPAKVQYTESAVDKQHQPWSLLKLDILNNHVNNTWVDYDCSLPAKNHVPDEAKVGCLVIGECVPSGALLALIVKQSPEYGCENWERLGIVQISKAPHRSGGLGEWLGMLGSSEVVTMRLV
jgi:hypothetical protein